MSIPRRALIIHARDLADTRRLGIALGALSRPGDLWALHGDLGAGKTALVRALAAGMGLDERDVCSPTFVVVNEYARPAASRRGAVLEPGAGAGDVPLVHIDAYRVGQSESDSLGLERVLDGLGVAAIEWPERLIPPPPDDDRLAHVTIEPTGPTARTFTLHIPEAWTLRSSWPALAAIAHADAAAPRCAACARPLAPANPGPFCSDRCQLADLHRWLTGGHAIPGTPASETPPPATDPET